MIRLVTLASSMLKTFQLGWINGKKRGMQPWSSQKASSDKDRAAFQPETATQPSTKATAMYLQKVSARDQFTEKDLDFIISTLAADEQEAQALLALLLDSESADLVFDDPALFQALQQDSGLSMVSSRFYLYLHLRKALKETGIDDREVADYLANMLARFSEIHRLRRAPSPIEEPVEYEIDLHKALAEANAYQRGEIYAYGGDRNLFMTGLHASYLRFRHDRHGAPGISFYEQAGRSHYLQARNHPLSREFGLNETYDILAGEFRRIRSRLNYLAVEYFN